MANIRELLNNIKYAIFGKEVRQSIHDAIEECYNAASIDHDNANMEVSMARGIFKTLSDRLNKSDENQIKFKVELDVERKRVDSFTALTDGSTTGDAELIDGRIGADGSTYDNIGNAIRTQFKDNNVSTGQIRELLLKGTVAMDITSKEGYLTQDGTFNSDERLHCKITNKIYCEEGWVFSYYGRAEALAVSYIMYKGNTIVKAGQINLKKTNITIPSGVDNIVFSSYNDKKREIILEVELIKPSIIIDENLIKKLSNSIDVAQLNDDLKNALSYTGETIVKTSMKKIDGHYASIYNSLVAAEGYACYELDVKVGDIYSYSGTIIYDLAPYHLLNKAGDIVSIGGDLKSHSILTPFDFKYLVIPDGVEKIRLCSGKVGGDAPFMFIKKEVSESIKEDSIAELIDAHVYEDIGDFNDLTEKYNVTNGNYINGGGSLTVDTKSQYSDYIDITDLTVLYVDAQAKYSTKVMAIYDDSKAFIAIKGDPSTSGGQVLWEKEPINISTLKEEYPYAKFIRFSSYPFSSHPLKIYERKSELKDIVKYLENKIEDMQKSNVLYKKKWVACGDSFTEGDFNGFVDENGLSGRNSPVIFDAEMRCYKTYPWWIAKRNDMTLVNEAKCGSTMALSKEYLDGTNPDINHRLPFSLSRYKQVPLDADYLTLWFGLNETNTPLGTLDDKDNRTILGAWNIVLEYFITNMPYCKIGIVISDGWLRDEFANGIISVAEYWGIPYLDMRNNPQVPLMLGGRGGRINLNPKAKQLRNKAFYVTDDNGHPNLEAHKYQSTFIENWLRSL